MFTPFVFWLWAAGLTFLIAGLLMFRRELLTSSGLDKLVALGPVFVSSALAVFAAEHFVAPRLLAQMVPIWMPVRLFWAYFVGLALVSAAISLVARKFVRLSATLLGLLFFIFVLTIYLPFAIKHPTNRFGLNFVLRESSFAGGAWALAGSQIRKSRTGNRNWMITFGRFSMGSAAIYFGSEQLLHPEFAPGVPDTMLTPAWVPVHAFWGYPVGTFLLLAGLALVLNRRPRAAAIGIAVVMILIAVFLHLPVLALTHNPAQMTDAINFVADTLLFAGTALLVAGAVPQAVR